MRRVFYHLLVLVVVGGVVLMQSGQSEAGVKGPCSECHTMHNSQEGVSVNEIEGTDVGPQAYLIKGADVSAKNPCLGCHKRNDDGRYFKDPQDEYDAPQVNVDPNANDNKLSAAGTYYYVTKGKDDAGGKSCRKGHNVVGMGDSDDNEDELLGITPPGGTDDCIGGADKQLTCAGVSGCHGKRDVEDPLVSIKGGHHSPATEAYEDRFRDGNTIASSYRMLYHVKGRVASNWEFGDHTNKFLRQEDLAGEDVNIYQGTDKELQGSKTDPGPDRSINGLCGECHGCKEDDSENGFHSFKGLKGTDTQSDEMASPWKRHPTDIAMRQDAESEYKDYPGDPGADYSQEVPVGFPSITRGGGSGELQKAKRVVLCVSCHRAHGSPYDDALRWDYSKMSTTSTDGGGCFRCHTKKYSKQK
ncbi:MAG: cytochrome c3 family protein [bacterium]